MKRLLTSLLLIIISCALIIGLSGCNSEKEAEDPLNNPSEEYVISCLKKVPCIDEIKAVTEDNDPNGQLNKDGGYTAQIYFSYELVNQDDVYGDTLIDKGTSAGGSIEVYKTKEEANKRNDYLSSFDGGILSSGSHTVIGTIIIRTSNELTATQQKGLENNIINALKGQYDKIVTPQQNPNKNNDDIMEESNTDNRPEDNGNSNIGANEENPNGNGGTQEENPNQPEDEKNPLNNPSEEYVISCLKKVPCIDEIKAVTEDNDPNGQLNKDGGYTAQIYFSYELVNQDDVYGDTLIDKGTSAGGSIEVYKTKEEANKRNDYLSSFDGGILSSGSHTVIGTIIIRTSNELTATQQKGLESNIISALTGELESIVNPFDDSNNENQSNDNLDYEYLIDFPARMEDDTCGHNVMYLVYYPSENANAIYADVEITKFTYTFDDSISEKLTIDFNFECYIMDMFEGTEHFAFEIVAYNSNNIRIATKWVYGEGDIDETVRVQTSLTLDIDDVKNGITIEFCNYEE
ncbi:MAG: hypothetical protein ACI3XS_06900 [Eubacteriales bacterium]